MIRRLLISCLLFAITGSAAVAVAMTIGGRGMPPAVVEMDNAAVVERFVGDAEGAYRIEAAQWVPAPAAASSKKSALRRGNFAKPVQIGFPREIPADQRTLPMSSLPWKSLADGSRVVHVQVAAPDAAGIRIAYRLDGPATGMELRFAGNSRDQVFRANAVPEADTVWSPVLEGFTGTIELRVMPGFEPTQFNVTLGQLSHLVKVGAELKKMARDIGTAGSCNIDIACVANPGKALLDIARATAKLVFTDSGETYECTGTLLNSTSGANYLYTAAHCISDQATASTLNTYWFFDAAACNSLSIPPYQLVGGGATLISTELTIDTTLLELGQSPPAGAVRAAWNATVIPAATVLVGIHHPQGDLKKYSQGTMLGYVRGNILDDAPPAPDYDKYSFIGVRWAQGTTEAGSSGSGVFTLNSTAGHYELRGTLTGGQASCTNRDGIDGFARMDLAFAKLAPYLQPSAVIPATNATQAAMVEYWNPQSDFYFMTSRESEKSLLDNLTDTASDHLWFRTGYWFKTDPALSPSTSSITRYFIAGAAKEGTRGSHFYTALNADRATVSASGQERFGAACTGVRNTFCNEGIDSYVATPRGVGASTTCLSNEQPIYRAFRGTPRYVDDGNHRYLTNAAMYNYMVNELGWNAEAIAFCARP